MKRKNLLISFVPVLATVSFVVTPTVAQATVPHWFADTLELTKGNTYSTFSWGTLTLANSNPAIEPLSCENAAIGSVTNPTGTAVGEGTTELFATADCADLECPEESGLELKVFSKAAISHWPSVLVESGTKNLVESTGVEIIVGCYVANTATLTAPPTTCTGKSDPEFKNGSGNLSQIPSEVIFTGEPEQLECVTESGAGPVKTQGIVSKSLKTEEYGSGVPDRSHPFTNGVAEATLEVKRS